MNFFRLVLHHKLFVHYATLIVVILGIASYSKMQREARPNVNFNRVTISAGYPGASPGDIEELILDPIEEKIAEVDGVEEYRSVAFSGAGVISVKIDENYANVDEVIDEVRRKVSEVRDLPAEVNDPMIQEIKANNIPVLRLALYGDLKPFEMKIQVEKLKDFLRNVEGVQSTSYSGLEDLQLKILADPALLDVHDVTMLELMSNLNRWTRQRPGGQLDTSTQTSNLTVGQDYNDKERLKKFIVRSNDSDKKVRLSDIARVDYDTEKSQSASIFADHNAILLTVVKKPFADAVTTVDLVKESLAIYAKNFPKGLNYKLYTDESKRVRDRLKIVASNAVFGLALVLIMLIIFLDWRSALVTSVGIPVAILGGICVIYAMGHTMNSLVLVGMILVLGMLVDDAIVVCENIYYHLEKGKNPLDAAILGVKEISVAVVATVTTTILAFLPIVFMQGIMGQFLSVIPLTVIAMLLVSLVEALIILPVHAEEIMRPSDHKASFFRKIETLYRKYVEQSIKWRWLVMLGLAVLMFFSVMQGKALFKKFMLFPSTGLDGLSVRVELPRNSPIDETSTKIKGLSKALNAVSEDTFESIYASVGSVTTGGHSGSRQNATHLGSINVDFTSDPSFGDKEDRIVDAIRKATKSYSEANNIKTSITVDRPGPPVGKPIQLQITAREFSVGRQIISDLRAELGKIEGVHSVETDLDGDSKAYRFVIDDPMAISQGIDPDMIARTIFSASTGRVTGEILKNNEKVEILVGLKPEANLDANGILQLKIRNNRGQAMPLSSFVKVVEERGPSSIQRFNGLRTITVFAEVDDKIITGKEANVKIAPFVEALKSKYPTVRIVTGGGEKDRVSALEDTMKLYILALVMIFMAISLTFQSVIYPFLVLMAVPMGLCGVVWALALHDKSLSLMSLIGIVGLSGVVVNISIILMKCLQEKLREGLEFHDAILYASVRRLRPILITTVTTLTGLAPTIYGVGGVDHFVQPIALSLGWGLFVAAFLSVFTLPAVISFLPILKRIS